MAITLLIQKPSLAAEVEPPYLFAELQQPGIGLLADLIQLAKSRPDITTGGILEHFADDESGAALQKLAVAEILTDPKVWANEFVGAMKSLDLETLLQRETALNQKHKDGGLASLSDREKDELRGLQPAIRALKLEISRRGTEN